MSKRSKEAADKQDKYQKQVKRQAMQTLNKLVSQFYEVFMDNDPEHELVAQKRKQIVAKWKMYCHQKNLVLEVALPMADEACKSIVDKYNQQLNWMEETVTKFDLSGEISEKPIEVLK